MTLVLFIKKKRKDMKIMLGQELINISGRKDIPVFYDARYETVELHGNSMAIIKDKKYGTLLRSYELISMPCGEDGNEETNHNLDVYEKNYMDTSGCSLIYTSAVLKDENGKSVTDEFGCMVKIKKRSIPPANAYRYLVASSLPILKIVGSRIYPDYNEFVIDNDRVVIMEDTSEPMMANSMNLTSITTFIPLYFYFGYVNTKEMITLKMRQYNISKESGLAEARRYVSNFF